MAFGIGTAIAFTGSRVYAFTRYWMHAYNP